MCTPAHLVNLLIITYVKNELRSNKVARNTFNFENASHHLLTYSFCFENQNLARHVLLQAAAVLVTQNPT